MGVHNMDTAKTVTPQDLERRSALARYRFRALIRLVIANRHWLEDVEDEQLTENVKKNVQLLTKKKTKGLLTLQEKGVLCKPAECRTDQEKHMLHKIIGGLKCFRKYPEDVKIQLAGVTYFVYYGPGRVIVRQNHIAYGLYFIVSGEVVVSITTWDPVIKENVTTNVGTMVAGAMFGEVSLLHDIPRTATITTLTPCELLCVKKKDFDIVLKESVKEQWDDIQKAMRRFTYFDGWDDVAVRECCIYSKIKPYIRDQTILGDGVGVSSSTYFVLKGQCRMIEHLLVAVTRDRDGQKHYKLYSPERLMDDEEFEEDILQNILDETKQSVTSLPTVPRAMFSEETTEKIDKRRSSKKEKKLRESKAVSRKSGKFDAFSINTVDVVTFPGEVRSTAQLQRSQVATKPSQQCSITSLPDNVETHFMQVCIFSETACFGLGENMRRRRVVAMSDYVECLLIPRYWLFQHNKSNLWTKIQQYLDTQIPPTPQVFKQFVEQRRWLRYRTKMATEMFGKPPVTARYNIPYSIRINEEIHFD